MVFPGTGQPRHPAQLYDGLGQVLVLILLARLALRARRQGELFWLMLVATSFVRIFSDLFRTELRVVGPLTLGQIGAIATMLVAAVFLGRIAPRAGGPTGTQYHTVPFGVDTGQDP